MKLTGDFKGMLRVADYAARYHGAFPVWMGPTDAFLMTVHPATVRSVLSGSGLDAIIFTDGFIYHRFSLLFSTLKGNLIKIIDINILATSILLVSLKYTNCILYSLMIIFFLDPKDEFSYSLMRPWIG